MLGVLSYPFSPSSLCFSMASGDPPAAPSAAELNLMEQLAQYRPSGRRANDTLPQHDLRSDSFTMVDQTTGYTFRCDVHGRPLPEFMPNWSGVASTLQRRRQVLYQAEQLHARGFLSRAPSKHLVPSLDLPPALPHTLGLPQKWCGYSQCPRPGVLSTVQGRLARGLDIYSILAGDRAVPPPPSVFTLPPHLQPRPAVLGGVGASKHSKVRPAPEAVVVVTPPTGELEPSGAGGMDELLALLRSRRKVTKGLFGVVGPPHDNGAIRRLEERRDRLIRPRLWAARDAALQRDREQVERRRREKYVLHYSSAAGGK